MRRQVIVCVLLALSLASRAAGEELDMQAAGAAAGPTTLWNFLGIPQGVNKLRDATSNQFGDRPASERKPALTRIADPKNLQSDNPAIKKAAQVKAAEDQAPQKIKALKYLARVGCGCYDQDGKITEAFLAALDDCTEEVRFQAAIAILDAAKNNCETCNQKRCCSEELSLKLAKIAYEKNDKCCWLEPSERVRMAATDALKACCECSRNVPPGLETVPSPLPDQPRKEIVPPEAPAAETVPNSAQYVPEPPQPSKRRVDSARRDAVEATPPAPPAPEAKEPEGLEVPASQKSKTTLTSLRRDSDAPSVGSQQLADAPPKAESRSNLLPAAPHVHGAIDDINLETATAQVRFSGAHGLRVGNRLNVQHKYLLGPSSLGEMEVIATGASAVTVRPVGTFDIAKLSVGDTASTVKAKKSRLRPILQRTNEKSEVERTAAAKMPVDEAIAKQVPADEPTATRSLPREPIAKNSWDLIVPEIGPRRRAPQEEIQPVKRIESAKQVAAASSTGLKSSRRQVATVAAKPAKPMMNVSAPTRNASGTATGNGSSRSDVRISDDKPSSKDRDPKTQPQSGNLLTASASGSSTLRMISDSPQ